MKRYLSIGIIFGVLVIGIVFLSWTKFPAWRDPASGGFFALLGATIVGVLAVMQSIVSMWKDLKEEKQEDPKLRALSKPEEIHQKYVTVQEVLRNDINIEAQRLSKQFKSMRLSSGQNRRNQHDVVMKTIASISENLLPHSNRILKDGIMDSVINEIHNQLVSYGSDFSMLLEAYEEKNKSIRAGQLVDGGLQDRINELERTIDSTSESIESMINRLIGVTQGD